MKKRTIVRKKFLAYLLFALLAVPQFCRTDFAAVSVSAENLPASDEYPERNKGEITNSGKVTLADAKLALRAALHTLPLKDEQLWAADLFDDGEVSLEECRIILRAALGLETVDSALLKNIDTVVENCVDIRLSTDKESYCPGDTIQVSARAKNTSVVGIPIYATEVTFGPNGAISYVLADEEGNAVKYPSYSGLVLPAIFFGTLMPGEEIACNLEMEIPAELELASSGIWYLDVYFEYRDTANDFVNVSDTIRQYVKRFPITIRAEKTE